MNIFALSARNKSVLISYVKEWINWIELQNEEPNWENVTYTLLTGRMSFNNRLCFLFHEKDDLLLKLKKYLNKELTSETLIDHTLASEWSQGEDVDWATYYSQQQKKYKKVSLPTYPFDLQTAWYNQNELGLFFAIPEWQRKKLTRDISNHSQKVHTISSFKSAVDLSLEVNDEPHFYENYKKSFEFFKNIIGVKGKSKDWVVIVLDQKYATWNAPFSSLVKTAKIEKYGLMAKLIEIPQLDSLSSEKLKEIVLQELHSSSDHVRYSTDLTDRYETVYKTSQFLSKTNQIHLVKEGGVYWVTGGAGGIGMLIAKYMASKKIRSTLFLSGRSDQNLSHLSNEYCTIRYRKCDVTSPKSVKAFVDELQSELGGITGIIHAAGVLKDARIVNKTLDEIDAVFAPKISGLLNIDQVTQKCNLDYLLLFSSDASLFGSLGQSDYASANAFLDAFASDRNRKVSMNLRKGATKTINWPLWEEGGMKIPHEVQEYMEKSTGIRPLKTLHALKALEEILTTNLNQVFVVEGDKEIIEEKILNLR